MKINTFKLFMVLGLFLAISITLKAQPGAIDLTFNSNDIGFANGDGAFLSQVFTNAVQQDGKYIVAGNFSAYNGYPINNIVRIKPDGNVDSTFSQSVGMSGAIFSIGLQSDGKIIIAGAFANFGGAYTRIARLNTNGTIDNSFSTGTGFNNTVTQILVQPDNKILASGLFTNFNASFSRTFVTRLNADGSNDAGFVTSSSIPSGSVNDIALQADGKVLIGGNFTSVSGNTTLVRIARLQSNGSIDPTFILSGGANDIVQTISVNASGRIFLGGEFGAVNGVIKYRAAMLNANGSLDITFPMNAPWTDRVASSAFQPDGKILVGLDFYSNTPNPGSSLLRLNVNSSLDTSFNIGLGANAHVYAISVNSTNDILVGGVFTAMNKCVRKGVALVKSNGQCDSVFMSAGGASAKVNNTVVQADGKIIIGGSFIGYRGQLVNRIARIHPNGTLDTTFKSGNGFNGGQVNKILVQPDGKILVGGTFSSYNDTAAFCLIRLLSNGTIDQSFITGTGFSTGSSTIAAVNAILLEPDGKIIVGGVFTTYNGMSANNALRLNQNGSLSVAINIIVSNSTGILVIARQSDGKLLFGGDISPSIGSVTYNRMVRANVNGTLDITFNIGTGFNASVKAIAIQSDGKILVGGNFTTFGSLSRLYMVRLTANGVFDFTFLNTFNNTVNDIHIQSDGKFIVGGAFTSVGGTGRNRIVRFNANGTIDNFFTGSIPTQAIPFSGSSISNITPQADGKLILAGDFISYGTVGRNRIARIYADCIAPSLPTLNSSASQLCAGDTATLSIQNGNLNTASTWYWYKDGCGTTLIDSGTTIQVAPIATTTYFVRGGGSCIIGGACSSITVQVGSNGIMTDNIAACTSYTWFVNNQTYTSSGNYTSTYLNVNGCASVRTLNLIINQTSSNDSNVNACNSYFFAGNTYTQSGSYTGTFLNSNGCDSLYTIHLYILNSNTGTSSVSICNSYLFGGNTYTNSGVYVSTFLNAAGCDSLHTLTLNITNSPSSTFADSACNTYLWQGVNYTIAGTYTRTFTNIAGCDSIRTLVLTLEDNMANARFAYISQPLTNSVKVVNLKNNLIVTNIPVGATPKGVTVSSDGQKVYVANETYAGNITVINTNTNTVEANISAGVYPFATRLSPNRNYLYVMETYNVLAVNTVTHVVEDTLVNATIRDVALNKDGSRMYVTSANVSNGFIHVINTNTRTIVDTIILSWAPWGVKVSHDGTKLFLTDQYGNGARIYNLLIDTYSTIIPSGVFPISIAISPDESKAYVLNFSANSLGVINLLTNTFITNIPVGGEPREVNVSDDGKEVYVTNSNSTFMTKINALTNTVIASIPLGVASFNNGEFVLNKGRVNTSSCGPFSWNGITYTSTGIYTVTNTNSAGCDSISTLNLTVNQASNVDEFITSCSNYTWPRNGMTYTTSGNYLIQYINLGGCDSNFTLHLTLQASINLPLIASACSSYTWSISGLTYTAAGTYTMPFTNIAGCDSSKKLVLNILNNSTLSYKAFITDTFSANKFSAFNLDFNYNESATTIGGGTPFGVSVNKASTKVYITTDNSLRVMSTQSNLPVDSFIFSTLAKGVVTSPDGNLVYVTLPALNEVKVISTANLQLVATISVGNSPIGIAISPDGSRLYVSNQAGNSVSVINTATNLVLATIPVGSSPLGICVSPNGDKVYVVNTNSGTVNVINTTTNTITNTFNSNSPYAICVSPDGQKLYISSEVSPTITIVDVQANYLTSTLPFYYYTSRGISISGDGKWLGIYLFGNSNSGLVVYDINSFGGYVSYVPMAPSAHLGNFIGHITNSTRKILACNEYSWLGNTYTSAGLYTSTTMNSSGCDSVARINLTITYPSFDTLTASACDSYAWAGDTFTASGVYTSTNYTFEGCVANHTLMLSILSNLPVNLYISACTSYTWNGNTYTASGIYSDTSLNLNGCDSITFLNLSIYFTSTSTLVSSLAYVPNASTDNVSVVDLVSNSLIATIPVGDNPLALCFSPDRSKVYVVNALSSTVSIISVPTNAVIGSFPILGSARGIAISPDGGRLYMTHNLTPARVTVINTNDYSTIATIATAGTPYGLSVSNDGSKLYVSGTGVHVINTNNFTLSTISLGGSTRFMLSNNAGTLLYASGISNSVKVIDLANNTLLSTISLTNAGTSAPMAISPDGSLLYVAQTAAQRISIISTASNTLLSTSGIVNSPSGLSVKTSGNSLFVLNQNAGTLSIYNAVSLALLQAVPVGGLPQTLGNFLAEPASLPFQVTACQSYTWNGNTYTISGSYSYTASNSNGCDSISNLQLTINPISSTTLNATACDAYSWNGLTYTNSGIYSTTYQNMLACDSVIQLHLIIQRSQLDTTITACDAYTWNGMTYTNSGNYSFSYTNINGCDSTQNLQLILNASTTASQSIMTNGSYLWLVNGITYTNSGVYTFTTLNASGCFYTAILFLQINNSNLASVMVSQDQSVSCFGLDDGSCQAFASPVGNFSYQLDGGAFYNNNGFFNGLTPGIHTICATDGSNTFCDTVMIYEPAPLDIFFNTDSLVSCQGNDGKMSIQITGGTALIQPYLTWWTNSNGDTLNNVLNDNFATSVDSLSTGTYHVRIEDDHGCFYNESAVIQVATSLSVGANVSNILCAGGLATINPYANGGVAYNGYQYLINGLPLNALGYLAGTYTLTATDAKSCSAISILVISQPNQINGSSTINACPSYFWNGTTYTQSGIYVATFVAVNSCDSIHTLQLIIEKGIRISPKVLLSGPFIGNGMMHDSLRTTGQVPLQEPYTMLNFNPVNSMGGETLNPNALSVTGQDAIVDWVHIEIRDGAPSFTKVATMNAILQRDGDVVDVTGQALYFPQLCPGNYFISIKHRNHLGVMTSTSSALTNTTQLIDFTSSVPVWNKVGIVSSPRRLEGFHYILWAGDTRCDKNVKYNGSSNDKDPISISVGSATSNNIIYPVYRKEDANMDAKVKYNNLDNDKNFILNQVLLANLIVPTPNTVISQHTPN